MKIARYAHVVSITVVAPRNLEKYFRQTFNTRPSCRKASPKRPPPTRRRQSRQSSVAARHAHAALNRRQFHDGNRSFINYGVQAIVIDRALKIKEIGSGVKMLVRAVKLRRHRLIGASIDNKAALPQQKYSCLL